jgi:hypothetical protein
MPKPAASTVSVHFTANFEANLASIEQFLDDAGAPQAYDALLDELAGTVLPNLERYPQMGRVFTSRQAHSVEVANKQAALLAKLGQGELREYLLAEYLLLYARFDTAVYLLAIKHHRQLSFDFESLW